MIESHTQTERPHVYETNNRKYTQSAWAQAMSGTDCASDTCTYQRRRKTLEIGVGHMTTTTQG